MVTKERVHEVILNEMGQSLSESMCQVIAELLNEPEAPKPCHGKALRDHMRKGGDPATFECQTDCTFANPCDGCKDRRAHPFDGIEDLGYFDDQPDGRIHKVE